ncbi:MAG: Ada metal-binding domain-containing protein [Planctomycetota bacterium]|jgi:hypothetical protein
MSKRAYYLISVVFIGLFVSHALTQDSFREPVSERMLLDSHVLTGIEKFIVQIIPESNDTNIDESPWDMLSEKIKQKFDNAKIDIVLRPISHEQPNASMLSALEIYINTLEMEDTKQVVFHIQTVFKTKACLDEQPLRHIKADVWKTKPVMKAVSSDKMPKRLTEEVLEQVQAFISAYKAANSKNADFRNENPSNTRLTAADLPKRAKTAVTPQTIQAGFVASKNSKVFHNADCQWVNKIKPENLVIYNGREQAVNAGKRPCKLCKP